jgi:hypothetical protein
MKTHCGERGVPPHTKQERSCHWAGGGAHCTRPYDCTQGRSNRHQRMRQGRGRGPQILPLKREVLVNIQQRGFSGSNKYPVQRERGPPIDLDRRGPRIDLDRRNLHSKYPIFFDDMDPRKQTSVSSAPKQLSVGNRSPFPGVVAGTTNDSGKYPSSFDDMDPRKQSSISSTPKQLSMGNRSPFPGVVAGTTYDSVQVAKKTTPAPLRTRLRSCSCSAPRGHIKLTAPQGKRALTPAKASTKPPASILEILHSQTKLRITTSPLPNTLPPPPSFENVATRPPSPKPLELTPTDLAIASATLDLMTAFKKHQTNSLSLLCVTTGTGAAITDSKMGQLRKHNVSLMLSATVRMQKAEGTHFSLKTLYKIAHSEEKEARRLFAKEDFVTSAANDTATAMSSVTDPDGFTTVSCCGGASSSSPPKQRPQSRSPPPPG